MIYIVTVTYVPIIIDHGDIATSSASLPLGIEIALWVFIVVGAILALFCFLMAMISDVIMKR